MSTSFDFASWPPELSDDQLHELTLLATSYALSHSLLYLPVCSLPPPAPTSAIHAPLSLLPAPFPRALFEKVRKLQRVYSVLYTRIALDTEFLDEVMGVGGGVADVDPFTRHLWLLWKEYRDGGLPEPTHLGIFRSDYLLHNPSGSKGPLSLRQVEFNTISSSFGALSERVAALHRYLLTATSYFNINRNLTKENFPQNETIACVADGLSAAHAFYGKKFGTKSASILFVVQPNERNVFDQRLIEYKLLETYGIKVIRRTLSELASSDVDSNRALRVSSSSSAANDSNEISVVYYRAGYAPTDYITDDHYRVRFKLQASRAINCPTLALQLAGGKKVQQVLAEPGVLERFLLPDPVSARSRGFDEEIFTEEDVADIRSTWVPMFGLGSSSTSASQSDPVQRALTHHSRLVLKPQREGGGNNVYRDSIPPFLEKLPEAERAAWIAMELIEPPAGVGGYLSRAGTGTATSASTGPKQSELEKGRGRTDVVSELGIFGWGLFGRDEDGRATVCVNEEDRGGWLVRTKGRDSDEGGVAVGFSVLDSVMLVD